MGGKLFFSYRTVFELAQSLRDSKTSDLNCSYEALVQKTHWPYAMMGYLHHFYVFYHYHQFQEGSYSRITLAMVSIQTLFKMLVALRAEPLSGKPINILQSKYFQVSCPKLLVICPQESFQLKLSTVKKTSFQE